MNAQDTRPFDVLKISAKITPDFESKSITGDFFGYITINEPTNQVYLDARIDEIWDIEIGYGGKAELTDDKIIFTADFPTNRTIIVQFKYAVKTRQALYFFDDQLWTQGQGKYTSYWLPSMDDMTDKIEFDISVIVDPDLTVISNGDLIEDRPLENGLVRWKFNMYQEMSSYLVMIAVGPYKNQDIESRSHVTIDNYYLPVDSSRVEPTYRYTKEIFDFLETKIGVEYPWSEYKQVPVRDFLYAGMENTAATVFSSAFLVDSIGFNDKNYVNVNAHELAHQWFGNLVTEVSAADHWLHEGFASYYALLAEREIFGDDYYYWKLFNTAEQLRARSDQGKGEALSNPKASSLTFYEKGTWALIMLDELLGTADFDRVIKTFLNQYAFKNATLDDFFAVATQVSGKEMTEFRKQWIDQASFPAMAALNYLSESPFLNSYMELEVMRKQSLSEKKGALLAAIMGPNEYLGQEAVVQLAGEPLRETILIYSQALSDESVLVRQAVIQSIDEIPVALQKDFEVLLTDDSYITQEIALFRLWQEFPQQRMSYLDRMAGAIGFREKNIRQLWLTLAIVTPGYREDLRNSYIEELMSYAGPAYSFETRELALNYLTEIKIVNEEVLRSLVNACVHPNWRFRNTARDFLNKQLDNPIALSKLNEIRSSLPQEEIAYLDRVLK